MANLPESAVYDAGVYQLETTDPVQGGASGVSNAPLKNLANRTTYLKQRVDNIESGATNLPGYAKSASPSFTGDPTAPTAALGDNDTSIATTAFVQATLGGRLSKSVAGSGSITLTAVEAGSGILELTGALTGNRTVILPVTPTRSWIIKNATSGAFTLTVKTAAGTGVMVTQGTNAIVWTDGTNVYDALTDFDSPVLTGSPTAPTPAQFDNDTSVATTEFVRRHGLQLRQSIAVSSNTTLDASAVGAWVYVQGAGGYTITLPLAATTPNGARIEIFAGAACTIQRQGLEGIFSNLTSGGAVASLSLGVGDHLVLVSDGAGWYPLSSAQLQYSSVFASSLNTNGYQKLPSGLIIQWGQISITSVSGGSSVATATFPIAYTSWRIGALKIRSNAGTPQYTAYDNDGTLKTGVQINLAATSGAGGIPVPVEYFFVGV